MRRDVDAQLKSHNVEKNKEGKRLVSEGVSLTHHTLLIHLSLFASGLPVIPNCVIARRLLPSIALPLSWLTDRSFLSAGLNSVKPNAGFNLLDYANANPTYEVAGLQKFYQSTSRFLQPESTTA